MFVKVIGHNMCVLFLGTQCMILTLFVRLSLCVIIYSVSQKIPHNGFLKFFPKRFGIFNQFLHTYYTIISTLDYKFLFKYLQL